MSPALTFLASLGKFGSRGGIIPSIRLLSAALETNAAIVQQEVEAGRISTPEYYSNEIQRYEESAFRVGLGNSRVI